MFRCTTKPYKNRQEALMQSFPVNYSEGYELVPFAFSCDNGFAAIIEALPLLPISKHASRAAILVGESNVISMLPELALHADTILLVDIDGRLHSQVYILLKQFQKSETLAEFITNYNANNAMFVKLEPNKTLLNYSFTHSEERYQQCRKALWNFSIMQLELDLTNKNQISKLANILKQYDTELTFCNFTNVHNYVKHDDKVTSELAISLPPLFEKFPNCPIASSGNYLTGADFNSRISIGLKGYLSTAFDILIEPKDGKEPFYMQPKR